MKKLLKTILTTTALAMVLGAGVAVGAHQNAKVEKAEAATTTVALRGSFNGWSSTANTFTLSGNSYILEIDLDKDVTFKVFVNGNYGDRWCGFNGSGLTNNSSKLADDGTNDHNFKVSTTGRFKFTVVSGIGDYDDISYGVTVDDVKTYTVSNGSTNVSMTEISPGADCSKQYEGVINITAGQTISFKEDGSDLSASVQSSGNNNAFTDNKHVIETTNSAHVYLKYNSGNWFFYVTGRSASYYVVVSSSTYYAMSANTQAAEGNYMRTGLELAASSTFRLYGDGYFAPSGDNFGQDDGLGFSSNGTQVSCTNKGTYNIYLDATQYNAKLYIGGQTEADLKATAFSNAFLDAYESSRGGICNYNGSTGAAYDSAISSAWSTLLSNYNTNVKGNTDAVNILKNADSSADTLYGQFAALYDKIYHDYGTKLSLTNFASRSVTPSAGSNMMSLMNEEKTTTATLAVVIVTVVSLTAVGGFFLLKKKKEIK